MHQIQIHDHRKRQIKLKWWSHGGGIYKTKTGRKISGMLFTLLRQVSGACSILILIKTGKIIAKNAKTGTELFLSGRLEQNRYENKDGDTIYDVSIIVEQFDFGAKADGNDE